MARGSGPSPGGGLAGGHVKLIVPILLGNAVKIHAIAKCHGVDLDGITIEDLPNHDAAAARAVELVHEGRHCSDERTSAYRHEAG